MNQTVPISPSPKAVGGAVPDLPPGANAGGGAEDASFADTLAETAVSILPPGTALPGQPQIGVGGDLALPGAPLADPSLEADGGKPVPQPGNVLQQAGKDAPLPVPSDNPARIGELIVSDGDAAGLTPGAKSAADQSRTGLVAAETLDQGARPGVSARVSADIEPPKAAGEPRLSAANGNPDMPALEKQPVADVRLTPNPKAVSGEQGQRTAATPADSSGTTAITAGLTRASVSSLTEDASDAADPKGKQRSAPKAPSDFIAPQLAKPDLTELTPPKVATALDAANPALASQPTPSVSVNLAADARGELRISPALEQSIEQLVQLRESTRASRPEILMRHAEFGLVNVRVEAVANDIRASLSARDPGFVPAVQAMIAERSLGTVNDTQSTGQRGPDGGQSGASGQTEREMAGSWGSSRGSESDPQETLGTAADFDRAPNTEAPGHDMQTSASGSAENSGLFA